MEYYLDTHAAWTRAPVATKSLLSLWPHVSADTAHYDINMKQTSRNNAYIIAMSRLDERGCRSEKIRTCVYGIAAVYTRVPATE